MTRSWPGTIVIGGGPAGAAAAIKLARGGERVLLLERSRQASEKVCGEFLGADAAEALARLGLDLPGLGAVAVRSARIAAGRRASQFDLPFAAWSLPRADLDAALLRAAEAAGAEVRFGTGVVGASRQSEGWLLRLPEGQLLTAPTIVLATGKHELRGLARSAGGGSVGLKLPLHGVAMGDDIALLACAGGYAGLQPRAGGGANLCLALNPRAPGLAAAARDARSLIAMVAEGSDLARARLRDAQPLWTRPLSIAGIPYGYLHRGGSEAVLFRVGDQASVIPSLCGDGIAMALASGERAARAILAGEGAAAYQRAWASSIRAGMRVAGLVGHLMVHAPGTLTTATAMFPAMSDWAARRTRMGLVAV